MFAGLLTFTSTAFSQKVNTSDYWQCSGRLGGSWTIGRASSICKVSSFQNPAEVNAYWSQVMYDDDHYNSSSSARSRENNRYGTEMNHLITGFAKSYFKKRKPNVSEEELEAWTRAILAVSHHESIWTHYRKGTDNVVRMLRGDFGHGHGLMQVDDRWHFAYVKEGGAARIQDNLIFGLDLFYRLWTLSERASCVGAPDHFLSRTRSTYSMYNGGEGSICRWRKTSHRWYKNDKNFIDRFFQEGWKKHLIAIDTFDYNFSCLVQDGGLGCFDANSNSNPAPPVQPPVVTLPNTDIEPEYKLSVNDLYTVKSKQLDCTWNDSFLSCLPSSMGQSGKECLSSLFGIENDKEFVDIESKTSKTIVTRSINPSKKCISNDMAVVGDFIETKVRINIRKTPGGNRMGTVAAGKSYQVLNIYKNESSRIIYYLISSEFGVGYIFTSDEESASNYTRKTVSNATPLIAKAGGMITVNAPSGINMRSTAGGTYMNRVPNGERLVIAEMLIRGDEKYLYYKVEYKNEIGFIYSGRLTSANDVTYWTEAK